MPWEYFVYLISPLHEASTRVGGERGSGGTAPRPRNGRDGGESPTSRPRPSLERGARTAGRLSLQSRPLAAAACDLLVIRRVFDVAASSGVPRSRLVETVSCKSFFVVQQGRAREQPGLAQGLEIQ